MASESVADSRILAHTFSLTSLSLSYV